MTKIVFPYCRDSGGDDQERSVGDQQQAIRQWADERGYVIGRWYIDEAQSGTRENREQFQQMIVDALREKPDVVITWNFARFARSQDHAQYYRSLLRRAGIEVVSLNEPVADGPLGRVVEAVIDLSNELQIETLRRDVKRGHLALIRRGFIPGQKIPTGYRGVSVLAGKRRDGTDRYAIKAEIDEEVAPLVRRAFDLRAAGASVNTIAPQAPLFNSKAAWYYMFHNPVYVGRYVYDGEEYAGVFPPLVDEAVWEACQVRGKTHPRTVRSEFLLTGLLRCAYCGYALVGNSKPRILKSGELRLSRYYICTSRNGHTRQDRCRAPMVRADEVERAVLALTFSDMLEPSAFRRFRQAARSARGVDELIARHQKTLRDIARVEKAIDDLTDMAGSGIATRAILLKLSQREDEPNALRVLAAEQRDAPAILTVDEDRAVAFVLNLAEKLRTGNTETKRWVLTQVIEELSFGPALHIKFKPPRMGA